MLYLDTSALLKLYIREQGSEAVQARIASQDLPLPIWEIQEAELINALRLKAFWKEITPAQAETQIECYQDRRRRGLYLFRLLMEFGGNSCGKCPGSARLSW